MFREYAKIHVPGITINKQNQVSHRDRGNTQRLSEIVDLFRRLKPTILDDGVSQSTKKAKFGTTNHLERLKVQTKRFPNLNRVEVDACEELDTFVDRLKEDLLAVLPCLLLHFLDIHNTPE